MRIHDVTRLLFGKPQAELAEREHEDEIEEELQEGCPLPAGFFA